MMCAGSDAESDGPATEAHTSKRHVRLVGVVDQLKRRLDVLRGENVQLEGMLHAADAKLAGTLLRESTQQLQHHVIVRPQAPAS